MHPKARLGLHHTPVPSGAGGWAPPWHLCRAYTRAGCHAARAAIHPCASATRGQGAPGATSPSPETFRFPSTQRFSVARAASRAALAGPKPPQVPSQSGSACPVAVPAACFGGYPPPAAAGRTPRTRRTRRPVGRTATDSHKPRQGGSLQSTVRLVRPVRPHLHLTRTRRRSRVHELNNCRNSTPLLHIPDGRAAGADGGGVDADPVVVWGVRLSVRPVRQKDDSRPFRMPFTCVSGPTRHRLTHLHRHPASNPSPDRCDRHTLRLGGCACFSEPPRFSPPSIHQATTAEARGHNEGGYADGGSSMGRQQAV